VEVTRREFIQRIRDVSITLGIKNLVPTIVAPNPRNTPEHDKLAEMAMISAKQGGSSYCMSELDSMCDLRGPTADADDYLWEGTGGEAIVPDWPEDERPETG